MNNSTERSGGVIAFGCLIALIGLAAWVAIGYVVVHFLVKWW